MDPFSALMSIFGGGEAAGAAGAAGAAAGTAGGMGGLGSILAAIQSPGRGPGMPQTTFPEQPRNMDPAFSQMVMQALSPKLGAPNAGLSAILAGRA